VSAMKQWKWFLLIFELVLFAVILILPQVDLPDFTFHGGTAPISAKARSTARPTAATVASSTQSWLPVEVLGKTLEVAEATVSFGSDSRLSRLCTLLC
jgi:hypothetical protein